MPEDKIIENATLPKKRVSPFEVEPIDEVNEPKKIEKKTKKMCIRDRNCIRVTASETLEIVTNIILQLLGLR